jgi:tricarballylate dehydrogenase
MVSNSDHDAYDVVVIGGGNAGLCAALAAREQSRKVLLIEKSAEAFRGGNSKYTRDIRCAHNEPSPYSQGHYTEEEFMKDLLDVTGQVTDFGLAKLAVRSSLTHPKWMEDHGVKWQKALKGTLHLARTNRFFIGGGKSLINTYYERAMKLGVRITYDSSVEGLMIEDGKFRSVSVRGNDGTSATYRGTSVVVAAGGFEANLEWLKEYWGSATDNFIVRGSRHNDGKLLRLLMSYGAESTGDPRGAHAIAVDARAPRFDGGIVTRVDSIPFGIVVNKNGKRFYDEGEDLWPKRYAIWGRLIAEQPQQIAYSIFDSKVVGKFLPCVFEPLKSGTMKRLSDILEIDRDNFLRTVDDYNSHVKENQEFDPSKLDACGTASLEPHKSHWALRLDSPPFFAYPLRPGITFTYLGVKVDDSARVLSKAGKPYENVYAAGEIMAGNILTQGYLAGFGLTIGTTFGRIAGEAASKHA